MRLGWRGRPGGAERPVDAQSDEIDALSQLLEEQAALIASQTAELESLRADIDTHTTDISANAAELGAIAADYLTSASLSGYATEDYVNNAITSSTIATVGSTRAAWLCLQPCCARRGRRSGQLASAARSKAAVSSAQR